MIAEARNLSLLPSGRKTPLGDDPLGCLTDSRPTLDIELTVLSFFLAPHTTGARFNEAVSRTVRGNP